MPDTAAAVDLPAEILHQIRTSSDHTVSGLRPVRRHVSNRLRREPQELVLRVVFQLIATRGVPVWFAYEVLHYHREAMSRLTLVDVERLGRGMSSWGEVDSFACYISGPGLREGQLEIADIQRWARSADRWWRRAALVSTVPLNTPARGGNGDAGRTLAICDLLKADRDDMVVKAMSWALRELGKREPGRVKSYLAANASQLASRVLREVGNKLRTGLKNPTRPKPLGA
jgi:hypothetical protein